MLPNADGKPILCTARVQFKNGQVDTYEGVANMQLPLPFIVLLRGSGVPAAVINIRLPDDDWHVVKIEFEENKIQELKLIPVGIQ